VKVVACHVDGVYHGKIGRHLVATAPATCSALALDHGPDAPVSFFRGPTGRGMIDTGPGGVWRAVSLDPADGPYPFRKTSHQAPAGDI
jgi:hypothetical protein